MTRSIASIDGLFDKCVGCGACSVACPVSAIEMSRDVEGFDMPVVDSAVCVECGKCLKVCQLVQEPGIVQPLAVAGMKAKDEDIRAAGSSGGIIGLLFRAALDDGGAVFGAVFDAAHKSLSHECCESIGGLGPLLRSKYIQSAAWGVYGEVRARLAGGQRVLFCGTPCQVAGLKLFLGRDYDGLLTVDFFCHGVPSPGFFRSYAESVEAAEGSDLVDVTFREKKSGWREQHIRWYFADGEVKEEPSLDNSHYFFFLHNYSLRKSCLNCTLSHCHQADLTVADWWLVDKSIDDDRGISLILTNTDRGEDAVSSIDALVDVFNVDSFDFSIYSHSYDGGKRDEFFTALKEGGVEYVCGHYFEREHAVKQRKQRLDRLRGMLLAVPRKTIRVLAGKSRH